MAAKPEAPAGTSEGRVPATDAAATATAAVTALGSKDLSHLLSSLSPSLTGPVYVYCTFPQGTPVPEGLPALLRFEETEGTTIVTPQEEARKHGVETFFFPCRCVTLTVHSSLEAVGMLAAITTHLAKDLSIGVNPVSAFYHDHLFVPEGTEEQVIQSLQMLAGQSKQQSGASS